MYSIVFHRLGRGRALAVSKNTMHNGLANHNCAAPTAPQVAASVAIIDLLRSNDTFALLDYCTKIGAFSRFQARDMDT